MTLPPPFSLQIRELFSDFSLIPCFSGLFIDWASSEWALSCDASPNFPSFSLKGKLAVPFQDRQQGRNRSSGECGWRKMPVPEQQPELFYGTSARINGNRRSRRRARYA
jgi:hypothetical protein